MLVVGEVLVDLIPTTPASVASGVMVDLIPAASPSGAAGAMVVQARFGGSPANVAVGLARLGVAVGFAGRIARAGYGPWLRAHLVAEGVDLEPSVPADEPCTLAVVTLDAGGAATYEFYGPGTADWAWRPEELPPPAALAGGAVHTGSLATALRPGAATLTAWLARLRRQGNVAITYDPNIRPTLIGDLDPVEDVVRPPLACAHLVKASDEDLATLYPRVAARDVAGEWLSGSDRDGPHLVVVTQGEAGATAFHRDGRVLSRPAPRVDVVDTVGAGDSFTAGLLSALAEMGRLTPDGLAGIGDEDLAGAVDRANLAAGVTCTRAGADPPRRAELALA